jgi:hypothetical protein
MPPSSGTLDTLAVKVAGTMSPSQVIAALELKANPRKTKMPNPRETRKKMRRANRTITCLGAFIVRHGFEQATGLISVSGSLRPLCERPPA